MTILNIRGTSGSGKSTLVHRLLHENTSEPILGQLSNWKKPKIIGYKVTITPKQFVSYTGFVSVQPYATTYVVGRYETQCGGCDSLSYKGSHNDIEEMVRNGAKLGNVVFEGLTISSTLSRWQRVSDDFPGQFVWAFMTTPEEECHQRILARNGGKEPKHNNKGLADYQIKYRGCMKHMEALLQTTERVLSLTSDDTGYEAMLAVLAN